MAPCREIVALDGGDVPDVRWSRGSQRLDFLFFRLPGGFETRPYRTLPLDFGSDHRPVMGRVRFAG